MTRLKQAFTLVEIVVALAVILILAAVALPNVNGFLDQKRIEATKTQLETVRDALYNPVNNSNDFFEDVGSNAGRLSELSSVIIAGNNSYATGTDDSCGNTFSNGERNGWLTTGPFMVYNSDRTAGMMTPVGLVEDTLTRIPNSANPGVLRLTFKNNVSLADAQLLDDAIESGSGYNAGVVQWTPQNGTNGIVTLYYLVNINGTC